MNIEISNVLKMFDKIDSLFSKSFVKEAGKDYFRDPIPGHVNEKHSSFYKDKKKISTVYARTGNRENYVSIELPKTGAYRKIPKEIVDMLDAKTSKTLDRNMDFKITIYSFDSNKIAIEEIINFLNS